MRWRVGILLIAFFACDDPYTYPSYDSTESLRATTNRTYYSTNDPVKVLIVNDTDEPIGFDRYKGTIYWIRDKWTDSGWVQWGTTGLYGDFVPEHWILQAKQTYADTILVRKPGKYRFRFPIWENNDSTRPAMLVSRAFEIQ